jgi:GT2 family glycosyltransferase
MAVLISALICTRNRADYLRRAIQSLVDQTLSPTLYEIIVVDNASEDATPDVIREFSHIPQLRSIHEPVLGLSRARNTAWQNARGNFVAYLDDDAVACSHWLGKYLDVFHTFKPTPGVVGGKCEPIWEVPQPDWLADHMLSSLSVYDWSDVPITLSGNQWISGCNIAFPVQVLRELGGFREDLGRKGNQLLSGEETFLQHQIAARGYPSIYHPDVVVGHQISPQRLYKSWFRRHAYGTGLSEAVMTKLEHPLTLRQRIQLSLKKILWIVPRAALTITATHPSDRFRRQYQIIETLGFLNGIWTT